MKCPECERTEQRLREAIRVLGKIAGTAEAAKQRDPAAYLQEMARKAWLALDVKPAGPSMAPTEPPRMVTISVKDGPTTIETWDAIRGLRKLAGVVETDPATGMQSVRIVGEEL